RNKPNFDFFNYAGLHRPVKIYTTPQTFIKDIEIVPEVKNNVADINYNVSINEPVDDILIKLIDEAGKVVAETTGAQGSIKVEQPHLWQPLNA
ncbi:beta-glucuronidase, partial [Mesorhizobium sp. M00.F.Ca.ET.217.01.1.1]